MSQQCTQPTTEVFTPDTVVKRVLHKYINRAKIGKEKYGHTLDRKDLSIEDWITHLQEELMDATLYLEKLKQECEEVEEKVRNTVSQCSLS
jgi:hypothetical protein|uniref:Uncharacterized protein n=1 Tax=viral metagenome TaxID=1070528 RepID=A0A6C0IQ37_9ZZZZ